MNAWRDPSGILQTLGGKFAERRTHFFKTARLTRGAAAAKPRGMRVPSTWFSLGVGFTGALFANTIKAQSRLMGYSPNAGVEDANGLWQDGTVEKVPAPPRPTPAPRRLPRAGYNEDTMRLDLSGSGPYILTENP